MRRRLAESLAVLFSIASLGAGAAPGPNSSEAAKVANPPIHWISGAANPKLAKKTKPYQVGSASWYGKDFQGKETASGEPYDMRDFTAAHPTLPMGTLVKITNIRSGKAVVVRVNDRGPVIEGRIIDVSHAAALALGIRQHGVQRVRLDLIEPPVIATLAPVANLR